MCLSAGQCQLCTLLRKSHSAAYLPLTSLPLSPAGSCSGSEPPAPTRKCRQRLQQPWGSPVAWVAAGPCMGTASVVMYFVSSRCRLAFVLHHVTMGFPQHPPHSLAVAQLGTIAHLERSLQQQPGAGREGLGVSPYLPSTLHILGQGGQQSLSPAVHSSSEMVLPDRESLLGASLLTGRKLFFQFFSCCRLNPFANNNRHVCGTPYSSWFQLILSENPV